MEQFKTLYLYESLTKSYSYVIKSEKQDHKKYGYPVTEMDNVSLQEFIGQLIIDGYPSNVLEVEINKEPKALVDFELADQAFRTIMIYFKEKVPAMKHGAENLELFWNKLSKSSSFAHKAHKELKKLN